LDVFFGKGVDFLYTIVYIKIYFCIRLYTEKGDDSVKNDEFTGHSRDSHPKGHRHKRDHDHHHRGAKTFRRGRAIAFLEMMNLKRSTLKQQLEAPEFQSIQPILIGELKAVEMVINEFVQLFELHEFEATEPEDKSAEEVEDSSLSNDEPENSSKE